MTSQVEQVGKLVFLPKCQLLLHIRRMMTLKVESSINIITRHSSSPPLPPRLNGGLALPKIPRKGGGGGAVEKLLKGREDPNKGQVKFSRKREMLMLLVWVFFLAGAAYVLTFNYILIIVFIFPLHAGFSPCFHCTIFSKIQLLVPITGHIPPVCIMQMLLLVSVWTCGFKLFLKCVIVRSWWEFTHIQFSSWSVCYDCFIWLDLVSASPWEKVHPAPTDYANCHYDTYQGTLST